MGGIIHRDNCIVPWDLYWRDCYWDVCEHFWNFDTTCLITGTSGIGVSVFRTIMVWWQIQKAKQLKSTEVILFAKPPSEYTFIHGAYIENGILDCVFSVFGDKYYELLQEIKNLGLHTIVHTEAPNGRDTLGDNCKRFVYCSPSAELKKQHDFSMVYLPSWSEQELHDFFLIMNANFVLVNKLRLGRLSIINSDRIPESIQECDILQIEPSDASYPLTLFETSEKVQQVRLSYGKNTYAVSYVDFKNVISDEMLSYGPIPRYMFMDSDAVEARTISCNFGIYDNKRESLFSLELGNTEYDLLSDMPLIKKDSQLYNKDYDYTSISDSKISLFLGAKVESLVLQRMVSSFSNFDYVESEVKLFCKGITNFKNRRWGELFGLCFMNDRLDLFKFSKVDSNSEPISLPFNFSLTNGISRLQIQRLTSREFESFLGSIFTIDVVASPYNNVTQYPIGVVRHFRLEDSDGTVTYITAFIDDTYSSTRVDREENSLNKMIAVVKAGAKKLGITSHRIEFWWLTGKNKEKTTSPWPYVSKVGLVERQICLKKNY